MKYLLIMILVTTAVFSPKAKSTEVNGSLDEIAGVRLLNLWGTWEEIGYAHAYLLGPDIKEILEGYLLEAAGGPYNYQIARTIMENYFYYPQEFMDYAHGMVAGMADTIGLWSDSLQRDMDWLDFCACTATPDLAGLVETDTPWGCSSAGAWGAATEGDPELNGSPAMSRNFDYYLDYSDIIYNAHLIITYDPDEGHDWVGVSMPGFMGLLSGMNELGVACEINMGNNQGTVQLDSTSIPICMGMAVGLFSDDYNNDGSTDMYDIMSITTEYNPFNSYDLYCMQPRSFGPANENAVIIEICNGAPPSGGTWAFRWASDEPTIAPDRMALTNHHRVLLDPDTCSRYPKLLDSLETNPDVTLDRLWNFMGAVGLLPDAGYGVTIQTMIFIPEQRKMGLAFTTSEDEVCFEKEPTWIEWGDLFPNHVPQGIEEGITPAVEFTIAPNPVMGVVTVTFTGNPFELTLYDISGRVVDVPVSTFDGNACSMDLTSLPAGVYRITGTNGADVLSRQVILLKQ